MAIGRTNIPIINVTTTDSGEYVRPVGAPDMDTIAANAPMITQGGINYYAIWAGAAADTFASTTFAKTGTGISTGADAYVFSDEPSTLYVGTSVSHTFNTALDYTTDQSWKARYYICYATEANKNNAAGITVDVHSYTATFEMVGTANLKLSSSSTIFGATSGVNPNLRYVNFENSAIYNNTISTSRFCSSAPVLMTLKLPDAITTVPGATAFYDLPILASLSMPNLITISGNSSFYSLGVNNFNLPKLTSISGGNSFNGFSRIKTLNLPELMEINSATNSFQFGYCSKLTNLITPKLVTFNGAIAYNTYSLKYFKLPNTITTITNTNNNTFSHCAYIELPANFNISGCNFTGLIPKSISWFHHLATQLADRSSTTAGTMVLGAANIALISAADAATIAAKNWTLS